MGNTNLQTSNKNTELVVNSKGNVFRFFVYSLIGIFMFFVPVTINNNSTIPLDHLVGWIQQAFSAIVPYYALLVILLGAFYPFLKNTWNKNNVEIGLSVFKVGGLIVAGFIVFDAGPSWLMAPNMGPFLFNKLVIPVSLLVPIGAVFLALIVGFGLLEFIGVLLQPVMRPLWKTPGRSAIDAVASFVGSYSIGLLITNRVYKEGKYTKKEAAIIATGFSTVSATFMIVVARTLGLMEIWNTYFWVTLFVTFLVTAITVRIWPISRISEEYAIPEGKPEQRVKGNYFVAAWKEAMSAANQSKSLSKNISENFRDGFVMTMSILPSIMSVGLLGLVLAEFTLVFDWIGMIFYPITSLLQIPDAMLVAKASAVEIAEMFLPALMMGEAVLVSKFIVGVVSISSIIFFSALIPCILSTEIPLSIPKMIIIWFERTILTLIIVTPIAYLLL
ncbi:YjiH family protein [Pontibacillus sp. HN14]|nr:YjiH family protein [Pontibacillus sp. HN14]MCD5322356.1 YjiH family protein [Pontibacillus sp. HN14]